MLALVMAAAMALSLMTGCADKNTSGASADGSYAENAEITTAATSAMQAAEIQEREAVFYESSQIESITADKTKGRLIETATSFSIVTKTDMEASSLQNIISVAPEVNFKVDKISDSNFKLELADPLPENSMAVISQVDKDGEAVYKWAFQTDGRFESKEFYPADGSDYVGLESGVEITFTAPVNAEGAENYFEITPKVAGKFQAHRTTLYFIPSEKFSANTRYTVTLKKEFTSADGSALPEDISFSFVTNNGDRSGSYCYASGMSETYIEGDPAIVEIYCSDGIAKLDFDVSLYQYASGEDYRKAMQGFIDSGKNSSQHNYSTDGLKQIYSDVQKPISSKSSWGPKFLILPDDLEEGYYLADISVKAGKDEFRIQRHIQVNPISVYSAYVGGKAQFFINDTVSGNAAEGAEISLSTADGNYSAKTDAQGVAMLEVPTEKSGTGLLEIKWGNSVYCDFYSYYKGGEPDMGDLYYSCIYTDRAIYNNDDTINVWGVIRPRKQGLEMPADLRLTLGYDGLQFPMEINSDGTFTASIDFKDLHYNWGTWVELSSGETTLTSAYVRIKDHIKPTYEFETEIPTYVMFPQENPFKVSVQANLFDGTAADGLTFEVSGYDVASAKPAVSVTDENGYTESEVLFKDSEYWQPGYNYVTFNLTGVQNSYNDAYSDTISFYRDIMVEDSYDEDTRKLELTASKITSENVEQGDTPWTDGFYDKIRGERTDITAKVTVTRHWSEKVEKGTYYDFLLKENVTEYDYVSHEETVLTESFTTTDGKYVIDIPDKKGSYHIDLTWKDSAGRNTKDSYYVYNQEYDNEDDENREKYFMFSTDTTSFTENQAVKFTLENDFRPYEGEGRILLQLHGTEFDDYAVYEGTSFSHVMTAECIPTVTAIGAYFDGRHVYPIHRDYYYSHLSFNPEEREIVLDIAPDKEKYAPGDKAVVTVAAKDKNGNIMPDASVVLSVADEASFAVANQHADPLNDIYKDVYCDYAIQYYSYVEHCLNEANMGEKGGGDGDSEVRKNFKDTAAFLTAVTDENGKATFEFELPDNITEWRATALAVYEKEADFVYAGASKHPVIVTQPLFLETILLDEIVEGDDLAVAAHCFGESAGTEKITVTLTGNGVNMEKSALAGRTVNFGKLDKGEYTVRFKAESGGNSDIVEKTVVVRDSLLEANVINTFNLADGVSFTPKSWPMCIVFSNAEYILYTDTLYKLMYRAGERLDMRIASAFAYKEFGFITEEDYIAEFAGITSTGLAKLMTNSEESVTLTAKICAAAPELVNKQAVAKRMYDVLESENSYPEDISCAYLALAALGEPVMTEIRDVMENSSFASTTKPDEFSIEDGLRLTAALALLGDFDMAIDNRFTTDMSKGTDKNGDETAYLPTTELTQTAIMPAAILRLPEADSIARHLIGTAQVYDSFALELMVYLNNYSADSESEAAFTYTRNGKTETVTLDRCFGTHITFTEEQFAEANFAVKSGEILAVANYWGNPTQNDTKPTLTVKKTISGDLVPGGLVTVRITVKGGADESGYNYYTVYDVVPSCGRYDESKNGWANANGQLLTLYTNQHGVAEYTFRISTSGKYLLESAAAHNYDGKWGMSEYTTITVNEDGQNT